MRSPFELIERKLCEWDPKSRRRFAVHLLVWSLLAASVNVALYLLKVIGQAELILITLILSWLAITFTVSDIFATADVREEDVDDG